MEKIKGKLEDLFVVKQTKYTGKRIFFTFALVILMGMSLPIYFMFEDYNYEKYLIEYEMVDANIKAYYEAEGLYPAAEAIKWDNEKNLRYFFEDNHFNLNRRLYYVDITLMPNISEINYTYIIDIDTGTLFTSEFKIYHFKRWHFARKF